MLDVWLPKELVGCDCPVKLKDGCVDGAPNTAGGLVVPKPLLGAPNAGGWLRPDCPKIELCCALPNVEPDPPKEGGCAAVPPKPEEVIEPKVEEAVVVVVAPKTAPLAAGLAPKMDIPGAVAPNVTAVVAEPNKGVEEVLAGVALKENGLLAADVPKMELPVEEVPKVLAGVILEPNTGAAVDAAEKPNGVDETTGLRL